VRVVVDVTPLFNRLTGIGWYWIGMLDGLVQASDGEHEIVAFSVTGPRRRRSVAAALDGLAVKRRLIASGLYGTPVVVLGAGKTGELVVRQMKANPGIGFVPVAMFDDDRSKIGTRIDGVPVIGSLSAARFFEFPYQVERALVAIPSARGCRVVEIAGELSV
jgi:hypothetical protein